MSPLSSPLAAIDVGTNSVLLLVARADADGRLQPLAERAEITRLGQGVDATQQLAPEAIQRTVAAIATFAAEARSLGATRIACVATSAARDAKNGAAFFEAVRAAAQLEVSVISGEAEARLSHLAAERDFGSGPKVVLDIGGGSTEFVFGHQGKVSWRHSFDLGAVRLTERLLHADPATTDQRRAAAALIDGHFAHLPALPAGAELIGIAGTVTTAFTTARALEPYDARRVHGAWMGREEVVSLLDRVMRMPLDGRRQLPGLQPKRADVFPAGLLILERAMARLGVERVRVSDRGVRWGLLHDLVEAPR